MKLEYVVFGNDTIPLEEASNEELLLVIGELEARVESLRARLLDREIADCERAISEFRRAS